MAPWLWVGGCLVLGGYVFGRAFGLWRAVTSERPVTDQQILELLEDCKMEMRVRTIAGVVVTDKVRTPALFGFVRPRILLPQGLLETISLDELYYVFLHELAHLKRRDIYLAWLVCLLQVFHWFNPLIWFAFRRMRADQEVAADTLALTTAGVEESRRYGRTILNLLERFSRPQHLPSLAGILENPSQLERRMTMITRFKSGSHRRFPWAAIFVAALACVALPDAPGKKTLAASPASPEATVRRIEVKRHGSLSVHSLPSFDGRYMAIDREGTQAIRELATGKERDLARPGGVPMLALISPRNTKIAYYWVYAREQAEAGLRVSAFDGSDDRLLWSEEDMGGWFSVDAWSPDERYLFGRHSSPDKPARLVRVSVEDGSILPLNSVDANGISKVDISPDGRFLAYHRADKTASKSDVFIFDLVENRESILVQNPADDRFVGWTPDGGHIFFTSDRMGTTDGWLLRVQQGKPKGLPTMVKPGIGNIVPIRFTRDGSLYYAVQYDGWNVYTVELDPATGQALSEPSAVRDVGKDGSPDWSPDGRYLAYCSQPDRARPQIIRIRTLATGEERELTPDLSHFDWLRWCPDSRHLLVTGPVWGAKSNVYRVDVPTGRFSALIDGERRNIRQAELSADGKTLVYRIRGGGNENHLIVRDLESGHERSLLSLPSLSRAALTFENGWTLLPDGKHVALSIRDNDPNSDFLLRIMSIDDGATKTIVSSSVGKLTWGNEGRDLFFVRRGKEIWRVALAGSEPQKMWEWNEGITNPRLHPDGRHLAFVSGTRVSEMWVMENFLPEMGE